MGFARQKAHRQFCIPDCIAVVLLAAVVGTAVLWLRGQFEEAWLQTGGRVLDGRVVKAHYNAPVVENRIELLYSYLVDGTVYTSKWRGFWPVEKSPNALPESRHAELTAEGYPLTVFYDARNPERSDLHRVPNEHHLALMGAMIALGMLTCAYLFRVYPKWRTSLVAD